MAKGTFGSENVQKLYARSGEGQGSDVVYVIECLSLHSVIASRRLQKEKDAMSSKLSGVNGWTGWSRRTVRR